MKKNNRTILLLFLVILIVIAFLIARNSSVRLVQQQGGAMGVVNSFSNCADAGYPVSETSPRTCKTPDGKVFADKAGGQENNVSISGKIGCLPKAGKGLQTMECVLGLIGDDGRYYGLLHLDRVDPDFRLRTGDGRVTVYGQLNRSQGAGAGYETAGFVDVVSIRKESS